MNSLTWLLYDLLIWVNDAYGRLSVPLSFLSVIPDPQQRCAINFNFPCNKGLMVCYGELEDLVNIYDKIRQWMNRILSLRSVDSSGDSHCVRVVMVNDKAVLGVSSASKEQYWPEEEVDGKTWEHMRGSTLEDCQKWLRHSLEGRWFPAIKLAEVHSDIFWATFVTITYYYTGCFCIPSCLFSTTNRKADRCLKCQWNSECW